MQWLSKIHDTSLWGTGLGVVGVAGKSVLQLIILVRRAHDEDRAQHEGDRPQEPSSRAIETNSCSTILSKTVCAKDRMRAP